MIKSKVTYYIIIFILTSVSWFCFAQENTASKNIPLPVSINALMVTLIDHSAHYIWDYSFISESRELTDREWKIVEYYAIQLAASGPLITLGGSGSMDDAWSSNLSWIKFSNDLKNGSMNALNAAKDRDKSALRDAGDKIVQACESCHDLFKPSTPTEGIIHNPEYDHIYHLLSPNDKE